MNLTADKPRKYILSKELDLCEGCGAYKHVIITKRKYYYRRKFRLILYPFQIIGTVFYVLWRILILPYLIWKDRKK